MARCERYDRATPISSGRRRGGAGSVEVNDEVGRSQYRNAVASGPGLTGATVLGRAPNTFECNLRLTRRYRVTVLTQ